MEWRTIKGTCTVEIDSTGRDSLSTFKLDNKEKNAFIFMNPPDLGAYGRAVPYYCEITVTKDQQFEIAYKIFDLKTKKLLDEGDR